MKKESVISLQHRAEDALVGAMQELVGRMSPAWADRIGRLAGGLVRAPLGIRRAVVEENLRRAFPDADPSWIERTARAAYHHLGREVAVMLRLATLDPGRIEGMIEMPDQTWAALEEARAEGRGLILATGHYGNWEMAAAAVAVRGMPIHAIVKRQSNPLVDARIEQARRRLGIETVDMGEAPRKIPRALLSGAAVGIVADQDARHSGVRVPFFGIPASSHRGPALFALRLGSPLFAAAARRLPDGRYLMIADRIPVTRTASLDADVLRVTAALASHLENEVRKDPTQYFWFHKRWKTPPREEPAPRDPGTKSHSGPGEVAR